jgi:hypothetical protein
MFFWGLCPLDPLGFFALMPIPVNQVRRWGSVVLRTPAWSWPRSRRSVCFSRGLSSAPVACSVSAMAVWSKSGTKKQLDFRGAFRHATQRFSIGLAAQGQHMVASDAPYPAPRHLGSRNLCSLRCSLNRNRSTGGSRGPVIGAPDRSVATRCTRRYRDVELKQSWSDQTREAQRGRCSPDLANRKRG